MENKQLGRTDSPVVKSYKLEDYPMQDILKFAERASYYKEDPASVNMWHRHWHDRPETLPYLIFCSERFANGNGQFFVTTFDDKLVAISGIQVSPFSKEIALGGVRSWVNPELRGRFVIGRHLLPLQKQWAIDNGIKAICLTFNSYNKKLINYFKRSGLGIKKNRNPNSMFFNGVHEVPHTCNIQYTEQWVIYDKIDLDFEFDWSKIKHE